MKTMDNTGLPQSWRARCTMLKDLGTLRISDHWPVHARIEVLAGRQRRWAQTSGPILEGWRSKSLTDEDGFYGSVMVKSDSNTDVRSCRKPCRRSAARDSWLSEVGGEIAGHCLEDSNIRIEAPQKTTQRSSGTTET